MYIVYQYGLVLPEASVTLCVQELSREGLLDAEEGASTHDTQACRVQMCCSGVHRSDAVLWLWV